MKKSLIRLKMYQAEVVYQDEDYCIDLTRLGMLYQTEAYMFGITLGDVDSLKVWISTLPTAMMMTIVQALIKQFKYLDELNGEPTVPQTPDFWEESQSHTAKSKNRRNSGAELMRLSKALSLSVAYAANIGGTASLTGTGPNLIFFAAAQKVFEDVGLSSPHVDRSFDKWAEFLGVGLTASPQGTYSRVRPLLTWQQVHEKMPWSLYLLLGAGYAIAQAAKVTGLSRWLGDQLIMLKSLDQWLILLIVCYIVCFATEVISNSAIATLMMPILAQLSLNLQVNPLFLMYPAALASSFAFMLPVATAPNAIVFSSGVLRVVDMVTSGLFLNIVCSPILVLATATWGNAFFHFDQVRREFLRNFTQVALNTSHV
ncbi:hypothetical protein Btru_054075 [Bulinus truncatus]|nr:hypothetical protein Btru_054075 [Bulinus truncatus]